VPINVSELAKAAERLPFAERLLLLERIARSLRRDLATAPASAPQPAAPQRASPADHDASLDDAELEELIAETLFEDLQ